MYISGEIRWFFDGPLPDDVREWFESPGLGISEPRRTDNYLLLPGCTTTGVKLREGRFEIKALTRPPIPASYANRISGLKDGWIKWSRKAGDERVLRDILVGDEDTWISVSKARHLRLFSLESGEPEELAPRSRMLAKGCQVELGAIELGGDRRAWSLSFEAFGQADEVLGLLDSVVEQFAGNPPPVALRQAHSMSYPVWLALNR